MNSYRVSYIDRLLFSEKNLQIPLKYGVSNLDKLRITLSCSLVVLFLHLINVERQNNIISNVGDHKNNFLNFTNLTNVTFSAITALQITGLLKIIILLG